MKKFAKALVLFLFVSLAVGLLTIESFAAEYQSIFSDTINEAWYYEEILFLTRRRVVNGYPDGSFRPDADITTAEFTKLIVLALDRDIPEKINLVKTYLQNNYDKKITNHELAAMVGYHEYHLNRLFAKYVGMNLHQYLLKVRLNQASYLILNTEQSLQAIAAQTGFSDYAHFSHAFKQLYGYAPIQYRKQLKEKI